MSRFSIFSLAVVFFVSAAMAQEAPPPPPFLQGASAQVIDDFHKLLSTSHTKTDQEIDSAVDDWVSKQDAGIKTKYAEFKEQMKGHHSAADAAHKAAVEKFSPEARAADEKLSAIATNPSMTAQQKGTEIEKIVNGLPPTVRAEIEKAMQG